MQKCYMYLSVLKCGKVRLKSVVLPLILKGSTQYTYFPHFFLIVKSTLFGGARC
jgi:hypothetical protein